MAREDFFISCDIEADGPIPGEYSMSSYGLCQAGIFDGRTFTALDPEAESFYTELRPITGQFIPEAAAVSGLDRDELVRSGRDPAEAMSAAVKWVRHLCGESRPVFCAYPLTFDWMFSHYYFERFTDGDPFGFSSALDLRSFYVARKGCLVGQATKSSMPRELTDSLFEHTHNALDDAKGQAELFQKMYLWQPAERPEISIVSAAQRARGFEAQGTLRLHDVPASDAPWEQIAEFAHTLNGYAYFGEEWKERFNPVRERYFDSGALPDDLDDLRACLFCEFRADRFKWGDDVTLSEPDPEGVRQVVANPEFESSPTQEYRRAIVARIREMLVAGIEP